jgi:hypothetical protein
MRFSASEWACVKRLCQVRTAVTDELEAVRADLLRLFAAVEVNPHHQVDQTEPSILVGLSPMLLFRGESLQLIRALQGTLSRSALTHGGLSRRALEDLLTSACRLSVGEGSEAAILWFGEQLAKPRRRWVFVEPTGAFVPADQLQLGACRLSRHLPADLVPEGLIPTAQEQFTGPVVVTEVDARDKKSAQLLARDRIEEATAILVLASDHRGSFPRHLTREPGGATSINSGGTRLIAPGFWDSEGRIHPLYRALSNAAERTDEERTNWERRSLASVRWFAKAAETFWPSEALIACMTTLESLFIKDRRVREKGREIADRFTERWVGHGWSSDEQREWLRELYRARNDAIHEGRRFVEDLQVDRLVDMTAYAVRWGAWHLDPHHADREVACETYADVMEHDLRHG